MKTPIETERLIIAKFNLNMAESVFLNSIDEDNKRFVPDEVFKTVEQARDVITELITFYGRKDNPLVYPILLKTGQQIGHIQAVPISNSWVITLESHIQKTGMRQKRYQHFYQKL